MPVWWLLSAFLAVIPALPRPPMLSGENGVDYLYYIETNKDMGVSDVHRRTDTNRDHANSKTMGQALTEGLSTFNSLFTREEMEAELYRLQDVNTLVSDCCSLFTIPRGWTR